MTDLLIVSGFLGSGKTTFINSLIKQGLENKKIAIIENDFGEISFDSVLLKNNGYTVEDISAGCICCTLTGDFIYSLKKLIKDIRPDCIIIEPSGVGRLSDIEKVCISKDMNDFPVLVSKITVVDAIRCKMYYENFGDSFDNQILNADCIYLSHTDTENINLDEVNEIIHMIKSNAIIYTNMENLIVDFNNMISKKNIQSEKCDCHTDNCCHINSNCVVDFHNHNEEHHHHSHSLNTFVVNKCCECSIQELRDKFNSIYDGGYGNVIRAKGFVKLDKCVYEIQYIIGQLNIKKRM